MGEVGSVSGVVAEATFNAALLIFPAELAFRGTWIGWINAGMETESTWKQS